MKLGNNKNIFNAEKALWAVLQNRELTGSRFIRRYMLDKYTIDFYNPLLKLAIELDAESFRTKNNYDKKREEYIEAAGIKLVRISRRKIESGLRKFLSSIYSS
jgi:very-short-patch-repair endonuclease